MAVWTKEEKSILWITSANHYLVHAFEMGFPALVIPLSQYFGISMAASFALGQGLYLVYGLGSLPAGLLSDKWNIKYMLAIGGLGAAVASLAAAAAPGPITLMIALTAVGLFASIYHPVGISLISHAVSARGRALGINGVFGNIGISSGPLIAGVCTYLWGWRSVYVFMAILSSVIGIAALFVRAIPQHHDESVRPNPEPERELARYFLIMCIVVVLGGFLYRAVTVSLPAYMEKFGPAAASGVTAAGRNPLANLTASLLMFGVYLGGIVGQYFAGRWADRYDLRKLYLLFYILVIPFVFLTSMASGYGLVCVAALLMFFELGIQPIENSLIARLTPVRWRSTAYGLKFILGLAIGSVAVAGVGLMQSRFGFPAIYRLSAFNAILVSLAAAILLYFSRGQRRIANLHSKSQREVLS